VAPIDAEDFPLHEITNERLRRFLATALTAGVGRVAALRYHCSFDLIDYECHHSTSN
jgi:hypothetical protein